MEARVVAAESVVDALTLMSVLKGYSLNVIKEFKTLSLRSWCLGVDNNLHEINSNCIFHVQVILENHARGDDYECPFARTSIALTKMLCDVLEINAEPRKLKCQTSYSLMLVNAVFVFGCTQATLEGEGGEGERGGGEGRGEGERGGKREGGERRGWGERGGREEGRKGGGGWEGHLREV